MNLRITDHALVRYMERVLQIDLAPIKNEMIAKVSHGAIAGAATVTVDGIIYNIARNSEGPAITTLYPEKGPRNYTPPPESRQRPHYERRADRWRHRKGRK